MGAKINYIEFLKQTDVILKGYFDFFGDNICCKKGCSDCCEKGDYPLTDVEWSYLIKGFISLEPSLKAIVTKNIKNMEKGGQCPFLVNKECSVYEYRPIVCRVHGLAYFCSDKKVKLPYCVSNGKNFSKAYNHDDEFFYGTPINVNLDTPSLLKDYYSEIHNLYDWFHSDDI